MSLLTSTSYSLRSLSLLASTSSSSFLGSARSFGTSAAWAKSHLSPAVYWLVHSEHIDPTSIKGTGVYGRILKGDVLKAIKDGTAKRLSPTSTAPTTASTTTSSSATSTPSHSSTRRTRSHTDIPLTNIRKVIAQRLSQSKQTIPHSYVAMEVSLDAVLAFRASLKGTDIPIPSVNDFVIRAAALALKQHPRINVTWDAKQHTHIHSPTVDISVAVATDTGLITPIVRNADRKRLNTISSEVKALATRAKENKLQPNEFQGGSFTISNLGMFGVSHFSAIINPPQACILAVGGGQSKVTASSKEDTFETHSTITVTLVSDERAVDGESAAAFLESFRNYLQAPEAML